MEKQLTVTNIVLANVGSVRFAELDADKKPVKDTPIVVVQFPDVQEAAKFIHGKKYNVAFVPVAE